MNKYKKLQLQENNKIRFNNNLLILKIIMKKIISNFYQIYYFNLINYF